MLEEIFYRCGGVQIQGIYGSGGVQIQGINMSFLLFLALYFHVL